MTVDPTRVYLPQLPRLILAVHAGLDAAGIGHGFGGALALAYATLEPRATDDIDINICAPVTAARVVLAALPQGTRWDQHHVDQITAVDGGQTRVLWVDPAQPTMKPLPIDLFFPQGELHAVVAKRISVQPFADTTIPVIAAVDIAIFKTLFDRPKDRVDLGTLATSADLDWDEVLRWVSQLVGEDDGRVIRLREVLDRSGAGR